MEDPVTEEEEKSLFLYISSMLEVNKSKEKEVEKGSKGEERNHSA